MYHDATEQKTNLEFRSERGGPLASALGSVMISKSSQCLDHFFFYRTFPQINDDLFLTIDTQSMMNPNHINKPEAMTAVYTTASSYSRNGGSSNKNFDRANRNWRRQRLPSIFLPDDFTPLPNTVVCGQHCDRDGTKASDHVGNQRLKAIATRYMGRYNSADRKRDKIAIITEILNFVKDSCGPNKMLAFVRFSKEGRWMTVDSNSEREKIGTVLRDLLHGKYRSSTKSKHRLRRLKKQQAKEASAAQEEAQSMMLQNWNMLENPPTIRFPFVPLPCLSTTL